MNSTRRLVKIYAQNLAAVVIMKERMGLMKSEENALQEEANKRVLAMESGARDLQSRLDREEVARSEATLKMEQAEAIAKQTRDAPLTAVHGELGELRQRLRQQDEIQIRSQQAWKQEQKAARRRHAHHTSQQSSSLPLSSKTSEAGWEYLNNQVSSQKGSRSAIPRTWLSHATQSCEPK